MWLDGVFGRELRPSYMAQAALFAVSYKLYKHGCVDEMKRSDMAIAVAALAVICVGCSRPAAVKASEDADAG